MQNSNEAAVHCEHEQTEETSAQNVARYLLGVTSQFSLTISEIENPEDLEHHSFVASIHIPDTGFCKNKNGSNGRTIIVERSPDGHITVLENHDVFSGTRDAFSKYLQTIFEQINWDV